MEKEWSGRLRNEKTGIANSPDRSKIEKKRRWGEIFSQADIERRIVLTESEIERNFRNLFKTQAINPESLEKAEELLEQLRPESPLYHRLNEELDELRKQSPSS